MKSILAFSILFCSSFSFAQIKNPGFEIAHDTLTTLPRDWGIKIVDGYEFKLDNDVQCTGDQTFRIQTAKDSTSVTFASFSQVVDFEVKSFKRIALTAFIKTKDVDEHAGLWCQIWDKKDQQIAFRNLARQGTQIKGTNEWLKYSLFLTINKHCRKLKLGGYLMGNGTAWFDQFAIEHQEFGSTPASREVDEYVQDLVRVVRKNSIYSRSINWKKLKNELTFLSQGAETYADASIISSHILLKLRDLGDYHSYIIPLEKHEGLKQTNLDERSPRGELLANNIGYIYVPGYGSLNSSISKSFAESIHQFIKELDTNNNIAGWIVDLRENSGGNMWPMITGLGPLIGEGVIGHFHKANHKVSMIWSYSNGSSNFVTVEQPYTLKNDIAKVAVLIGSDTGSSGEMTAISFIGRPNIKLFGLPSAGLTTSNGLYPLKDGSVFALASGYVSDRKKTIYTQQINPDVIIDPGSDIIQIASNWILQKD